LQAALGENGGREGVVAIFQRLASEPRPVLELPLLDET
jgi:hypothetical protein